MQVAEAQAGEFGNAQPGGVEGFEDGAVAQTQRRLRIGRIQHPFDFFDGEEVGQDFP